MIIFSGCGFYSVKINTAQLECDIDKPCTEGSWTSGGQNNWNFLEKVVGVAHKYKRVY